MPDISILRPLCVVPDASASCQWEKLQRGERLIGLFIGGKTGFLISTAYLPDNMSRAIVAVVAIIMIWVGQLWDRNYKRYLQKHWK